MINYILKHLLRIKISLLSPREGDVLLIIASDKVAAKKLAFDISESTVLNGLGIIVLESGNDLTFMRNMPDEWKEMVRKGL